MGNLLVYKASAGSGKTYSLALEYIKLALQNPSPTSYRRILAVTFTNKATAEMKERILLHLYNLAHGGRDRDFLHNLLEKLNEQPATDEEGRSVKFTEALVCRRAERTLQAIIHDYDHFRVETIDSFFQSLLTNLAHELNLPRTFRVDLNDAEVTARAINRLLAELGNRKSKDAAKYVMDYMDECIEDEKGWNMVKALCEFAQKNMRNETYIHYEDELTQALADTEKIRHLRETTREYEKTYGEKITEAAQRAISLAESVGGAKEFSNGGQVLGTAQKILNGDILAPPSKRHLAAMDDYQKLIKSTNKNSAVEAQAPTLSQLLKDICAAQDEYARKVTTGKITLSQLSPMRLLRLIEDYVKSINDEANRFMLSKTPELFSRIVKTEDASFVFERVGTTFDHIMIDEFQDTSRMQWGNFHKLLVECMAEGNQCMLVGDIKQSIYRWRGGDWAILNDIDNDPAFQSRRAIPLDTNYRSKRHIVEFNNAFFPKAAKTLDAADSEAKYRIADIYADVAQKVKENAEGGWVRLALSDKNTLTDSIYEDIYAQIVLLHNQAHVAYRDMGILVRIKSEGSQLIEYFSSAHPEIPINSNEAFKLNASPAVVKLVCALRYIATPDDREARLQLLTNLGIGINKEEGTFTAGYAASFESPASELPEMLADEASLKKLHDMPLYELCQQLIAALQLNEENDNGQSAYLFYFLDAVLDFLSDSPSDLNLFLDYWDTTLSKQSTTGDTGDSIYVMTVHASKGLARHTILIPFCEWDLTKFRETDFLWTETPHEAPYNALPVTAFKPSRKDVDKSLYGPVKQNEMVQQRIDNLNTLYVAFTRAKQNLLIWSRCKAGKKDEAPKTVADLLSAHAADVLTKANEAPIWERLSQEEMEGTSFPDMAYYDANEESKEELQADDAFTVYTSGSLSMEQPEEDVEIKGNESAQQNPLDNPFIRPIGISLNPQTRAQIEFRQSNSAKEFLSDAESSAAAELGENAEADESLKELKAQRTYIDRGKLLHRIFSQIRTLADLPAALHSLKAEGVLSSEKEAESMARLIEKRVTQGNAKQWFDGSWQLFNECDILYRDKSGRLCTRRPDRVMVKDGHTVVVDFKFGKPNPEEYARQVNSYIHFLRQMGHTQVDGYIWYVLSGKVEKV